MRENKKIETLIIPAAGAGTRLRPVTYATPKEILRLVDKPIFYYLLAEAYQAGIKRVIFVTHKDNKTTKKIFSSPLAKHLLADFPGRELIIKRRSKCCEGLELYTVPKLMQY